MSESLKKVDDWTVEEIDQELDGLAPKDLVQVMREALSQGMKCWTKAARAYHMLLQMGEAPKVSPGLDKALRRLGAGEIHPAAWEKFRGTYVGQHIHRVDVPRQKELADGEPVKIFSFDDGHVTHRKCAIYKLDGHEQRQVLGSNGLRDAGEQRSYIEARRARKVTKADKSPIEVVKGKRKRGIIVRIDGKQKFITHEELSRYAADTA